MQLSAEERQKLSSLFLSKDDSNTALALDIMSPYGFIPELLTELFIVFKLTTSKAQKAKVGALLKANASPNIHAAMAGRVKLNSESTIKRNIGKYVKLSKQELDGLKLGRALYNKFDLGFAFLMKEGTSEEIKALLEEHIQGTTCDLRDRGLKTMPKEFFEFTDLEEIDLSNNYIENINKHYSAFTKLRKLDLSQNSLKKMHDSLSAWQNLEELNLNNNYITVIPEVLASFKSLRWLSMTNMLSMKEFGDRAAMPKNFAQLQLKYLALAQKNTSRYQFDFDLPQVSILQASGDAYLDLSPLGIAKHSFEMGETSAIRYLLLYAEPAYRKKVLATIYDAETKTMDFKDLGIYAIPEEISAFDIRILNLHDARLAYKTDEDQAVDNLFDPIGTLSTLENLNLNYNGLDHIPTAVFNCKNLKVLSLSGNNIVAVPPEIKHLQALESLRIRSSKHSNPIVLPDEMKTLQQLNTLAIDSLYHVSEAIKNTNIQRIKELFGDRIPLDAQK